MLCVAYNALNLIEFSKILIIDWYQKNGFSSFLRLRPEFVTANMVVNSKVQNKYGIDPSTKPYWLRMLRNWLSKEENIQKIDFPELLTAWANFKYDPTGKRYNCDITIATSLCIVSEEDDKEGEFFKTEEIKEDNFSMAYTVDANGNLIMI